MKRCVIVASWLAAGLVVASCGRTREANAPASATANGSASNGAGAAAIGAPETHALGMLWGAIGCFVGGPWSEALGAVAEERTLADVARCRAVETKLLDRPPTDGPTLDALRSIDPKIVEAIATAFEKKADGLPIARKKQAIAILRASADAAREALEIRKAAAEIRAKKTADDAATKALGVTTKLEALRRADGVEANVVFLVLAADRMEAARGLPPAAKIAVAAPAMRLIFGITPKGESSDERAWIDLLLAAGRTGKHPPKLLETKDEKREETHAKMMVAAALAEKFDEARKALGKGVVLEVATGYVDRLRTAITNEEQKETVESDAEKPKAK